MLKLALILCGFLHIIQASSKFPYQYERQSSQQVLQSRTGFWQDGKTEEKPRNSFRDDKVQEDGEDYDYTESISLPNYSPQRRHKKPAMARRKMMRNYERLADSNPYVRQYSGNNAS